ncbi:hypothetical protein Fot_41217 [Forsythia ovata]|uniref:Uncharacterized protein n=1 Tax=Forsythia ovata TaxID=205694 RepID=A0ABD1RHP8_9LAMI
MGCYKMGKRRQANSELSKVFIDGIFPNACVISICSGVETVDINLSALFQKILHACLFLVCKVWGVDQTPLKRKGPEGPQDYFSMQLGQANANVNLNKFELDHQHMEQVQLAT